MVSNPGTESVTAVLGAPKPIRHLTGHLLATKHKLVIILNFSGFISFYPELFQFIPILIKFITFPMVYCYYIFFPLASNAISNKKNY